MTTFLATFVVNDQHSDTDAINSAVSMLDFMPVAQAANMHVFLIRSSKSRKQLESLLSECLDPADYAYVVPHSSPSDIAGTLQAALTWVREE